MSFKKNFIATCVASGLVGLMSPASAGQVISWVAPYNYEACKVVLQRDFGGVGMKDGLTYLALQFWQADGPNVIPDGMVPSAANAENVAWFRDWGKVNNVKVTLCVTNTRNWDWPLAVRSFRDNRSAFAKSLVSEMERNGLDGIELDLEGGHEIPDSAVQRDFAAFVKELSLLLKPKGKVLTVATFPYIHNMPNWDAWADLLPNVDGVTSMGYELAGMNSQTGFNYEQQAKKANFSTKFMIGMPGYENNWQGNSIVQHLEAVKQTNRVGVGIWNAELKATDWQTSAVWNVLREIKKSSTSRISTTIANPHTDSKTNKIFNINGKAIRNTHLLTPGGYLRIDKGAGYLIYETISP